MIYYVTIMSQVLGINFNSGCIDKQLPKNTCESKHEITVADFIWHTAKTLC